MGTTIPFGSGTSNTGTIPFGGNVNQPAQSQQPLSDSIWSQLAGGIQSVFPGKQLGQALGNSIGSIGESVKTGSIAPMVQAGQQNIQNAGKIIGDTVSAAALPASLAIGAGTGTSVIGRIGNAALKYGTAGVALSGGNALAEGSDIAESGKSAALGGITGAFGGAAAQGLTEVAPWVAQKATQLLSHTSNTPEEAFNIMNTRPTVAPQIGIAPEDALKNSQGVVRGLRTSLTQSWENGVDQVAQEFSGQRVGLPSKLEGLMHQVDSAYGLDSVPQNIANMSAKELITLQTEVNGLANKPNLVASPEGIIVRKLADQLSNLGIKTFGGDTGSYATLYSNYSTQKGVLDAANDIVAAYKTGKPIPQTQALARLSKLFEDNRPAYLHAIQDLESATGQDVLSKVAASKFTPILPKLGGNIFKNVLEYLFLPLTSPRMAGAISRGATNLGAGSQVGRAVVNVGNVLASSNKKPE